MTRRAQREGRRVVLGLLKIRTPKLTIAAAVIAAALTLAAQTGAAAYEEARRTVLYVGAPAVSIPDAREAGAIGRSYADDASPRMLMALGYPPQTARERAVRRAFASVTEPPLEGTAGGVTAEAAISAGATYMAQMGGDHSPESGDPGDPRDGQEGADEIAGAPRDASPVRPELGDGEVAVIADGTDGDGSEANLAEPGVPDEDSAAPHTDAPVPSSEEPDVPVGVQMGIEGDAGDDVAPGGVPVDRDPVEGSSDVAPETPGEEYASISLPDQEQDPAMSAEPSTVDPVTGPIFAGQQTPTIPVGEDPSVEEPPAQPPGVERPVAQEPLTGQADDQESVLAPPEDAPTEPPSSIEDPSVEQPEVAEQETVQSQTVEPEASDGEPGVHPSPPPAESPLPADTAPTDTANENDTTGETSDPAAAVLPPAQEQDTSPAPPAAEQEERPSGIGGDQPEADSGRPAPPEVEQQDEEEYAVLIPAPVGEDPSTGEASSRGGAGEQSPPAEDPGTTALPYAKREQAMAPEQATPLVGETAAGTGATPGEITDAAPPPPAPLEQPGPQTPAAPEDSPQVPAPGQDDPQRDVAIVLPVGDTEDVTRQETSPDEAPPPEAAPPAPPEEDTAAGNGASEDAAPESDDPLYAYEPRPDQPEAAGLEPPEPEPPSAQEPRSYPDPGATEPAPAYTTGNDTVNAEPYPPEEEAPSAPLIPASEQDGTVPEQSSPADDGAQDETGRPQGGEVEYAILPVPAQEEPSAQGGSAPAGEQPPEDPATPTEGSQTPTIAVGGRETTTPTGTAPPAGMESAQTTGEPADTTTPPGTPPGDEPRAPSEQAGPIPAREGPQEDPGPLSKDDARPTPEGTIPDATSGEPETTPPIPPADNADGGLDLGADDPTDVPTPDGIPEDRAPEPEETPVPRDPLYASAPRPSEPEPVVPEPVDSQPLDPEQSQSPEASTDARSPNQPGGELAEIPPTAPAHDESDGGEAGDDASYAAIIPLSAQEEPASSATGEPETGPTGHEESYATDPALTAPDNPSGATDLVPEPPPDQSPPSSTPTAPEDGPAAQPPVPDTQATVEGQEGYAAAPVPSAREDVQIAQEDRGQEPSAILSVPHEQQTPSGAEGTVQQQDPAMIAAEAGPEEPQQGAPVAAQAAPSPTTSPEGSAAPSDGSMTTSTDTTTEAGTEPGATATQTGVREVPPPVDATDSAQGIDEKIPTPEEDGTPGITEEVAQPADETAGTAETAVDQEQQPPPSTDTTAPQEEPPPTYIVAPAPDSAEEMEEPPVPDGRQAAVPDRPPRPTIPTPLDDVGQPSGDATLAKVPIPDGSPVDEPSPYAPAPESATPPPAEDYEDQENTGVEISPPPPVRGEGVVPGAADGQSPPPPTDATDPGETIGTRGSGATPATGAIGLPGDVAEDTGQEADDYGNPVAGGDGTRPADAPADAPADTSEAEPTADPVEVEPQPAGGGSGAEEPTIDPDGSGPEAPMPQGVPAGSGLEARQEYTPAQELPPRPSATPDETDGGDGMESVPSGAPDASAAVEAAMTAPAGEDAAPTRAGGADPAATTDEQVTTPGGAATGDVEEIGPPEDGTGRTGDATAGRVPGTPNQVVPPADAIPTAPPEGPRAKGPVETTTPPVGDVSPGIPRDANTGAEDPAADPGVTPPLPDALVHAQDIRLPGRLPVDGEVARQPPVEPASPPAADDDATTGPIHDDDLIVAHSLPERVSPVTDGADGPGAIIAPEPSDVAKPVTDPGPAAAEDAGSAPLAAPADAPVVEPAPQAPDTSTVPRNTPQTGIPGEGVPPNGSVEVAQRPSTAGQEAASPPEAAGAPEPATDPQAGPEGG